MNIVATDLLAEVYQGRYFVDTSEIVECVDLPVSPIDTDKLIPEGQYRPMKLVVFMDIINPAGPTSRTILGYLDKFLPGYLVDITDMLLPYAPDPMVPVPMAIGFSVIINVDEVFYEVPVNASIVKQQGGVVNSTFADMAEITTPDVLTFVSEIEGATTTEFKTAIGIMVSDIRQSSGVFRLVRAINPVFVVVIPANVVATVGLDSKSGFSAEFFTDASSPAHITLTSDGLPLTISSVVFGGNGSSPNLITPFTTGDSTCTNAEVALNTGLAAFVVTHNGINSPMAIVIHGLS